MTREDIISMAREAGARAQQDKNCEVEYLFSVEQIERLLAAEREACAKICDKEADYWPYPSHGNAAATSNANEIRKRGQA